MSTFIGSTPVESQVKLIPINFNPPLSQEEIKQLAGKNMISQAITKAVPQVVEQSVPKVVEKVSYVAQSNESTAAEKLIELAKETAEKLAKENIERVKILTSQEFGSSLENAGYDLRSFEETEILPGKRKLIKTDLRMQMPSNMFFKVESRSGLALKGIDAKAGVIDCSYRNIVGVILHNYSDVTFQIKIGDRIGQGLFLPVLHPVITRVNTISELDSSLRGEKGFGSSGIQ